MLPSPSPDPADEVVRVTSLAAALDKLNVKIPIEDLVKAIHDEEEAERMKLTAEAMERRAMPSKLALQPTQSPTTGLKFITVSKFVPEPTKPAKVDPLAKQRRIRLLELSKQAFPDGKVPDPFITSLGLLDAGPSQPIPAPDQSRVD